MYPPCSRALGALALLAAIPSSAALAAEADTATVIVTATRQPQRANELLADVSTITREEIEAAGQTSLPELLAREPGITYSANGAPGSRRACGASSAAFGLSGPALALALPSRAETWKMHSIRPPRPGSPQ